ncbi:MAG: plasmid mobilization protein [Nocardioidaceae bacterium]
MTNSSKPLTEAELAKHYEETRDLSSFEGGTAEPVEVRRNVTISVRFSDEEIALLRSRAAAAGAKVTAYIRAAALQQAAPLDRLQLLHALEAASADVARAEELLRTTP